MQHGFFYLNSVVQMVNIRNIFMLNVILPIFIILGASPASSSHQTDRLSQQNKISATTIEPNIRLQPITAEDGLYQKFIYPIFQDSQGFLWLGTEDGLVRYDGYNFKVFRTDPDDTNSLSHNRVRAIFEDTSGRLWVGTEDGGLNLFDRYTEKFYHIRHNAKNPNSLGSDMVNKICQDQNGAIWIATNNGLNKLIFNPFRDPEDANPNIRNGLLENVDIIRYVHDPENLSSLNWNEIWDILIDHSGVLWVSMWHGLQKLQSFDLLSSDYVSCNEESKSSSNTVSQVVNTYQHHEENPYSLIDNGHPCFLESKSRDLWIGTQWGIHRFDRSKGHFIRYPFDKEGFQGTLCMTDDHLDNIWVSTYRGVAIFHPETGKFHYYQSLNKLGLYGVFSLYTDRTDNVWIGTNGKGLFKYNLYLTRFSKCPDILDKTFINDFANVRLLYEDSENNLWVAKRKLYKINRVNYKVELVTFYWRDGKRPYVNSMIEDHNGIIWLAAEGAGIFQYNPQTGRFTQYTHDSGLIGDYSQFVLEDKSGQIWAATVYGLQKWHSNSRSFSQNFILPKNINPTITCVFQDKSAIFWIGSTNGLYSFKEETGSSQQYHHITQDSTSLSYNHIYCLHEDPFQPKRYLWIGTAGGGLNRFDKVNEKFIHYTEKHGLPNNTIYGILSDDDSNLWLSTGNGLSKTTLNAQTSQIVQLRNYYKSDGLQANEFTKGAYFKNKKGELFFGGTEGFNIFHPSQIKDSPYVAPIVITDFKIRNKSISHREQDSPLRRPITQTKEITLAYNDNTISFDLAALDFTSPQKNRYAYKLENFDKDWIELGSKRTAYYTNLPPGEYLFRAKGTNHDGVWNEEGTTVKIFITPPWWRTWWAYAIYALLVFGTFYGILRFDIKRRQLKHNLELEHIQAKKLQELDRMNSRFFANISHEFRTPITMILGPIEKMLSMKEAIKFKHDLKLMRKHTNNLLGLINQLLDLSKLESGKMQLQASFGNIVQYLKGVTMSFDSLAECKQICLRFKAKNKNMEMYFDRNKIEKIFINLLSNALKFTPEGGAVMVVVEPPVSHLDGEHPPKSPLEGGLRGVLSNAEFVQLTVSDTGIGIPQDRLPFIFDRFYQVDDSSIREHQGTGIGLALVKELVELHHGSIQVESVKNKGTTFTIHLPMGKDHLKPEEIVETPSVVAKSSTPVLNETDADITKDASLPKAESLGIADTIILVIEDNADVRTFIREQLAATYQVIEAGDGEQGIRKAMATIPDLVISDVMMPKKDGYQVCHALKTDEKTSHIPVILLTAKAAAEDKFEGLETGADDYLIKPFDSKELMLRVKNLIEIRRKLRQRFSKITMLKPSEMDVSSTDKIFLQRLLSIVEEHLSEEDFTVEQLCKRIGTSSANLWRKIHGLFNQNPNQFIRSVRLQHARRMLEAHAGNVAEVAYAVGFNNLSYFAKCFRDQFGHSPSFYKGKKEG